MTKVKSISCSSIAGPVRISAAFSSLALASLLFAACAARSRMPVDGDDGSGDDAATSGGQGDGGILSGQGDGAVHKDAASAGSDGSVANPCTNPLDQAGCGCSTAGATRACYTGAAATENKGLCKDGMQTCVAQGEFTAWGPCQNDVLPAAEVCSDDKDHDCNGHAGCADPACAAVTTCQPPPKACQSGQTQACYDGPAGTSGVGQCKAGSEACDAQGQWATTCSGEVKPGTELFHCSDGIDNDCNGKTDCDDLGCILDPSCKPKVCQSGATEPCYDGPAGTSGNGACHGGTWTCGSDGQWPTTCPGEVTPGNESAHCADGIDNDCDGKIDCADPSCDLAPNCCTSAPPVIGTIYAHSPDTLYTVDPNTWALTTVGDFNANDEMTDLAVTPNGSLYTISYTALYSVDPNTAQASPVMDVPGAENNGLTFLPDGTLLAVDQSGALKKIDPVAQTVTAIGNYGNGYGNSGDLVAVADGTMFGISATGAGGSDASTNNILLRVDVGTGVATAIGPMGFGSVWGLAYYGGQVIAFTDGGQIVQVDPGTGAGTLLSTKSNEFWGAGTSPLVAASYCH